MRLYHINDKIKEDIDKYDTLNNEEKNIFLKSHKEYQF